MKAEIITIGDELLIGQVIDTNSTWIAEQLNDVGIEMHYKCTVSDNKEAILKALKDAENRSNLVILTGGLGPTKDDITKHTFCEYFNSKLKRNKKVEEWVEEIFKKRNLPIIEVNLMQADLPENCEVLWNRSGTAPGMWFESNQVIFASFPGVPFEMKTIFKEEFLPKISTIKALPSIVHRTIQTCSLGESFLAKKIEHIENSLPSHIRLAYLPNIGTVRLRFSAYGNNAEALHQEIDEIVLKLKDVIGEHIYAEGEQSLAETLGKLLIEKGETISTAESCTGGFLSHLITAVPGSSAYYKGSVIAYDNTIKKTELEISEELLTAHGAVSEACVLAMASKIRTKFNTDYAIATSGIAGPGGGTNEKPVGTVWIGIASKNETKAYLFNMGDHRERTILRTALMGMDLIRKLILTNSNNEL
jgi:nicotinamide-nucleotide amidase